LRTVNNKLDCNKCFYEFCFLCAEPWHFEKPCSKVGDKSFLKWASSNNIKKCPNCYMIIQKTGGCPHMSCSKCNYSWCWLCGNSSSDHNEFKCLIGNSWLNFHWYLILGLLFYPILFPFCFLILLVAIEIHQGVIFDEGQNLPGPIQFFIKHYLIVFILVGIASPIIVGIGLTLGLAILSLALAIKISPHNYNQNILLQLFKTLYILTVGSLLISLGLSLVFLTLILAPVAGMILFIIKIFYKIISIKSYN
jgi:IBR domain, a half RING-finger domain